MDLRLSKEQLTTCFCVLHCEQDRLDSANEMTPEELFEFLFTGRPPTRRRNGQAGFVKKQFGCRAWIDVRYDIARYNATGFDPFNGGGGGFRRAYFHQMPQQQQQQPQQQARSSILSLLQVRLDDKRTTNREVALCVLFVFLTNRFVAAAVTFHSV